MLLIDAFTLLNDERTVCTRLWCALSSDSLAPTKLYCACLYLRVSRTATVRRQIDAQADFILPSVAVSVTAATRTAIFGIGNTGGCTHINGRHVAGLR